MTIASFSAECGLFEDLRCSCSENAQSLVKVGHGCLEKVKNILVHGILAQFQRYLVAERGGHPEEEAINQSFAI